MALDDTDAPLIPHPVLRFWGKARPPAGTTVLWHPVVYHLLDVAATAEAILRARRRVLERIAQALRLTPEEALRLIVLLIALHDLGKFGRAFQGKEGKHWPDVLGRFVQPPNTHHTSDGYALWNDALGHRIAERVWPAGAEVFELLGCAVFGHHGRPVVRDGKIAERLMGATGKALAQDCADVLIDLLHPEPLDTPAPDERRVRCVSWWLSGLVTLADWVGSNEEWFPYTAASTAPLAAALQEYRATAQKRAALAVRAAGLESPLIAPARTFAQIAGFDETPSHAQQWASSVDLPPGPVLIILEDVTGSGKTEAAQMLVHRLMVDGHVSGAYWAMPTQATANAMYTRQSAAISALFRCDSELRPSLVLAHGHADLNDDFRATVLEAVARSPLQTAARAIDAEMPAGAACAAFLADNSRASLIADVGAGTVDQAILGVLPSRFNTLRLFGLADKVLVLDEAHAYDPYVNEEVRELLRFQAALGGCAIVLSATLTHVQREALVRAWLEGRDGVQLEGRTLLHRHAYPLATLVGGESPGVHETPVDAADRSRRTVHVRFVRTESELLDEIKAAVAKNAAVAWVRNTVRDCLAAAAEARVRGLDPIVFHARFAQGDRQTREREVLARFGKKPTRERAGQLLIATQVIEQSLDLDMDVLYTDLAPIDLLIQRAGRLRRHERIRPPGLGSEAELVVLAPPSDVEPDRTWLSALLPGTAAVYKDAGILWRTAVALEETRAIATPDGVRALVERVYDKDGETPAALEPIADRARGQNSAAAATARYTTLKVDHGYNGHAMAWMNDMRVATRLGDQSTVVRLARVGPDESLRPWVRADGAAWKAWALSEVRVRASSIRFGAEAAPRFREAIQAVRETWGTFERETVVLPLKEVDTGSGEWRGMLTNEDGKVVNARYTAAEGLALE